MSSVLESITNTEINALIKQGAELIQKRGHCQFVEETPDGKLCIAGSLNVAAGHLAKDFVFDSKLVNAAFGKIREALGTNPCGWNNEEGRTKEQVVAKMLEIAAT